jgi:FtsP/CotA-like multicopper oxidase with cupredoxin domain
VHAGPAEAGGGGGNPPHLAYRVDIPKTLPAALLGRIDPQRSGDAAPYPSGLYWIHAHLHPVSRPQVTEGMSGVISVGAEKDSIAPYPPSVRDATDVRYLALRDIQLVTACPSKNGAPDCSGTIPPLESIPAGSPAEDAGESYNSGLCANPGAQGSDWCAGLLNNAANSPIAFQYWLFSVTGQLDPTITVPQGRNHLWRVANLSANVSYVLKLCDTGSACKDRTTGLHPMTVVSEDGVETGSRSDANGPTTLGVEVDRLLMMPASRAAILVRNDAPAPTSRRWLLRNESFDTGPGPIVAGVPTETGDTWPNMTIAEIDLEGSGAAAAAQMQAAAPELVSIPRVRQIAPSSIGRDPATRPDCSFLPRDDATHKYRRQIIFDEDNANTIFRLGSQRVDQSGVLVADGRNIAPAQFPHMGPNGYTGDDFPPGLHVCATLHRGEVWELINSTDELHNFHIHQGKFRLARRGDPGIPDGVEPFQALQDPSHLLDGLVADDPSPDPSRDLWHDTFPVPPRKGDVYGRVFVFIPFEAEEQVGRFVFHCHILEHEDHGMMAAMEVVRETPEKDEQSATDAPPTMPMHH